MSVTIWLYVIWTAWLLVALVLLADTARAGMIIFFLAVTLFLLFEIGLDWRVYLTIWLLAHVVASGVNGFRDEKKDLAFGAISFGGALWLWLQGGAIGRYYMIVVLGSVGAAAVLVAIGFLICLMVRVRPLRNEVSSLSVKLAEVRKGLTELRAESVREISSHRLLENELRSKIENLQSQLSNVMKSSDSCSEKIRRYEAALALIPDRIEDGSSTVDSSQSATVTAVRVTAYWEPQDDKPAESGKVAEEARPMATDRDRPGRIIVALKARQLRRSEMEDIDRFSAAYLGHLLRGGGKERLEEATSAAVAERLADPAYRMISRVFPVSR